MASFVLPTASPVVFKQQVLLRLAASPFGIALRSNIEPPILGIAAGVYHLISSLVVIFVFSLWLLTQLVKFLVISVH